MLEQEFKSIIDNIKKEISTTKIKIAVEANKNLIMMYYRLGEILNDNFVYGNKFIEDVSRELKLEFPKTKGFSVRNLKYMKKFYIEYKDYEDILEIVTQIPWGHNIIIMTKIEDVDTRRIYLEATIQNNWGRNMLAIQIENNYHLRIGNSINNFNLSLPDYNSDLANNTIKDPYIFDFISLNNDYKERELEYALVEKIKDVLLELGKGFSFVGNQYMISTDNNDYYIDLLFYHLELRCYIVVELKITEFKPEYIGQLSFYVKAVDKTLKKDIDNPTIGLLLCKEKDRLSVEWSLDTTNVPIGVSSFELDKYIPKEILENLPTEEDINLHIDIKE